MTAINEKPVVGQTVRMVSSHYAYGKTGAWHDRQEVQTVSDGTVLKVGTKFATVRWARENSQHSLDQRFNWAFGNNVDPYGSDKTRMFTIDGYARQARLDVAFAELENLSIKVTQSGYSRPDLSVDTWEAIVAAIKADRHD